MRPTFLATAAVLLAAGAMPAQNPRIPRPAPPIEIILPDGSKLSPAKYSGKVCVLEFLFTTCSHCQEASKVISRLNREFGPKGLQPLGAAFNDNAMMLVPGFIRDHQVNYPVGVAPREKILEFLGYSAMQRLSVPLIAFIDKKGQVRYQSAPDGGEVLHSEERMRQIIQELLKEPGGPVKKTVGASQ